MSALDNLPTPPFDENASGAYQNFLRNFIGGADAAWDGNDGHGVAPLVLGTVLYRTLMGLGPFVPDEDDLEATDPLLDGIPLHPGPKPVNTGVAASNALSAQFEVDNKAFNSLQAAVKRLKTFTISIASPSVITALSDDTTGMRNVTIEQILNYMKTHYDKRSPQDIVRNNLQLSTKFTGDKHASVATHIASLRRAIKEAARLDDAKSEAAQLAILCDTVLGSKAGRFDDLVRNYTLSKTNTAKSFDGLASVLIETDKWYHDKTVVAFGTANAAVADPPPEASAAVSLPPHLSAYVVNLSKLNVDERALFVKLAAKAKGGPPGSNGQGAAATVTYEPMMCVRRGPGCAGMFTPHSAHVVASGRCKPCYDAIRDAAKATGGGKK